MTDRYENVNSLLEEQKVFELNKDASTDQILDTIIVKRKNINFKRIAGAPADGTP